MPIDPPRTDVDNEERRIDCRESLELTLQQILDEAQSVGWSQGETMTAVEELIIAFRLEKGSSLSG